MDKTIHLVSLGCPKNLIDSEVMLAALERDGYRVVENPQSAALILVNTCGFIQSAAEEAIDEILTLSTHKKNNSNQRLVVAGCLVQRYGEQLREALPEVDLFLGLDDFPDIAGLLNKEPRPKFIANSGPAVYLMDSMVPRRISTPFFRAYLKITEGCDNHCSYCMIPSIRGRLRSRSVPDLVQEAQMLESSGVKELTLIAQDLTRYGYDKGLQDGLVTLLQALLQKTNIPWIRLLYLYPSRVSRALLTLMQKEVRIVPYLDIPMQHVSDPVLKAMRRQYGKSQLDELISAVHAYLPDCAIRTTFMVGFPGEREEDVQLLLTAIAQWRLDHVGVFAYQDEEECAAFRLPTKAEEEVKEDRLQRVMEAQAEISAHLLSNKIGQVEPVLIEGISQESELLLEGRTRYQAPDIDGCVYISSGEANVGDILSVRIVDAHVYDLVGEVESPADQNS